MTDDESYEVFERTMSILLSDMLARRDHEQFILKEGEGTTINRAVILETLSECLADYLLDLYEPVQDDYSSAS